MLDGESKKMRGRAVSGKAIFILCVASFLGGSILTTRTWSHREKYNQQVDKNDQVMTVKVPYHIEKPAYIATNEFDHKRVRYHPYKKLVERKPHDIMEEVARTHQAIRSLDKTVSTLEMELAVARTSQAAKAELSLEKPSNQSLRKAFVIIGINTAFSSKKKKGLVKRNMDAPSATPGGVLDRAIDAEDAEHKDFLRLNHVEGYHELSTKTRLYFSTVMSIWDSDFYVKVDDDVHLNLGMLASTLARYRTKPRIYIGCMKSGPVLSQKGVKYHEPEFWKFGEEGNKYFRHATGQLYAISKDLAAYISINAEATSI
ncbi:putative beta-1,3-galactosyltransferase 8 [Drosera capensis]